MILCPLEPVPRSGDGFLPAWDVVMRSQKQRYESCWIITQPSHAALSGEIGAPLLGAWRLRFDFPRGRLLLAPKQKGPGS